MTANNSPKNLVGEVKFGSIVSHSSVFHFLNRAADLKPDLLSKNSTLIVRLRLGAGVC